MKKITYIIMGRSRFGTEEIDEFDTFPEAKKMLAEYRMAFNGGWTLWVKSVNR